MTTPTPTYPEYPIDISDGKRKRIKGRLTVHLDNAAILEGEGEINGIPYRVSARFKRSESAIPHLGIEAGEWIRDFGAYDIERTDVTFGGPPTLAARAYLNGPVTQFVSATLQDEAVLERAERVSNLEGALIQLRSIKSRLDDIQEALQLAAERAHNAGASVGLVTEAIDHLDRLGATCAAATAQVKDYEVPRD